MIIVRKCGIWSEICVVRKAVWKNVWIIQFILITLSNMSQCLCEIPLWQKSHLISFSQSFPYLHVICIMLPKQLKGLDKEPYNHLIPTLLCTASLICRSLSCYLLICVCSEKAPCTQMAVFAASLEGCKMKRGPLTKARGDTGTGSPLWRRLPGFP